MPVETYLERVATAGSAASRARNRATATREALEREIRAAHRAGASLRAIAEAAGISFQRVQQILTR